jgi:uncharacterized protein with von Willebrand factor type A (vWA) domain
MPALERKPARPAPAVETAYLREVVPLADGLTLAGQIRLASELAEFWRSLRRARLPRLVPASAERVDLRGTLREFVRNDGALTALRHHQRLRERRLVILADCTESALRPGLTVLVSALLQVHPRIAVLGFDTAVFRLRAEHAAVPHVARNLAARAVRVGAGSQAWLDLTSLAQILRDAARLTPVTPQTHLLLVSDLFVHEEARPADADLRLMAAAVESYRKAWVLDLWPRTDGFLETETGAVSASGRAVAAALTHRGLRGDICFRQAETDRVAHFKASEVARLRRIDGPLLRGWRFTPVLRRLGFVTGDAATARSRRVYVPQARVRDFAPVFTALAE